MNYQTTISIVKAHLQRLITLLIPYIQIAITFLKPYLQKVKYGWDKIWQWSIFNKERFKEISFGKKILSIGYTLLVSLLLFIIAFEINFLWLFGYMPSMLEVITPRVALQTEIYSADEELMGIIYVEQRKPITFEDINPQTIDALIATEDIRFYKHHGLDFYALSAAFVSTLKGDRRGASTITQQLVKNIYKTRRRSARGLLGYIPLVGTIIAKLKEWLTALKIEIFLDKNEILTLYFNAVEFGNHTYGLQMASEYYFSKNPIDLRLEESALLIGILKGTSLYNPVRHKNRAQARRNVVLSQMEKYDFIDEKEKERAERRSLRLRIKEVVQEKTIAPYFRAALIKELQVWCEDEGYDLYTDGLKIYTTIDSRMQSYAERAVRENMIQIQRRFESGFGGYRYWIDAQIAREKREYRRNNPESSTETRPLTSTEKFLQSLIRQSSVYQNLIGSGKTEEEAIEEMGKRSRREIVFQQGKRRRNISAIDSIKHTVQLMHTGLVSIDPQTGGIKAWVGGINWEGFQFDHVNQARRQPGSTFKPILYAAALRNGFDPCTKLVDKPVSLPTGGEQNWEPRNSNRLYSNDSMTFRTALARSVNTIAAQLTEKVGPEEVIEMAERLGIESPLDETLSIGLGTSSVSLLELTRAYTAFSNGGKLCRTRMVDKITDRDDEEIAVFKPKSKRVLSEEEAYSMTFLLRGSVEDVGGTSRRLSYYGASYANEIGGKTGTTTNYADGWFIGLASNLVTGVWVGADNMRVHFDNANGQGGRTALPIFGRYMLQVYSNPEIGYPKGKFLKPKGYEVELDCALPQRPVLSPPKPKPKTSPQPDTAKVEQDSIATDSTQVQQDSVKVDSAQSQPDSIVSDTINSNNNS